MPNLHKYQNALNQLEVFVLYIQLYFIFENSDITFDPASEVSCNTVCGHQQQNKYIPVKRHSNTPILKLPLKKMFEIILK